MFQEVRRFIGYHHMMNVYHLDWWQALATPPKVIRLCVMADNTENTVLEMLRDRV